MSTINNLEFAAKFSSELDKVLEQESKTGFLAQNDFGVKFIGAKQVKIPTTTLIGLGDYDVDNGFPKGKVTLSQKTFEVSKDRARTFTIDAVEIGDTGVEKLAGEILGEFVRTKVTPEMDAYVISTLTGLAVENSQTVSNTTYPLETKPYEAIMTLASKIDEAGFDGEKVCFMTYDNLNKLNLSPEISKMIDVGDFKNGEVEFKVKRIGNISIIGVPSLRMKSAYTFDEGTAQNAGGFAAAKDAKDILMLMMPKRAASLVKKHESIRTFSPEQNLKADAWKFDYRLHYDVFVKASMEGTVWAMVK